MVRKLIAMGLFLAVSATFTVVIGLRIAKVSFGDTYTLVGNFTDASGLKNGDPVKLAGVSIGQVTKIKLVDGTADVTIAVDKEVPLPTDTVMVLRWRNLVGQRDVFIEPGTQPEMLATDGTARFATTQAAVDLGALVDALGPLGNAFDPHQLNEMFVAINQALEGNTGNISNLITKLSSLSGLLISRDATIGQLLTDYETIARFIDQRDVQIQTMIDNIVLLSQSFTDNTALFQQALGNLDQVARQGSDLLVRNRDSLHSLIGSADVLSTVAVNQLDQLENAFANLPATLRALFTTINEGEFLKVVLTCLQPSPMPCTLLGGHWVP